MNSGSDIDGAAAAKGATAEWYRRGIAFNEADLVETHSPEISGDLLINCFVTLAVPGGAGGDDQLPG